MCCRDLLFGSIYDTFSGEDDLSKTVFLEHLYHIISSGKLSFLRTVVAKDFIGTVVVCILSSMVVMLLLFLDDGIHANVMCMYICDFFQIIMLNWASTNYLKLAFFSLIPSVWIFIRYTFVSLVSSMH